MNTLVALLRAVNVGGTGVLSMRDLSAVCVGAGFEDVRTYIQSGNVVFRSRLSPEQAGAALARALLRQRGAKVDVLVRDAPALREVVGANPFSGAQPSRVSILFYSEPVPKRLFEGLTGPAGEQVVAGAREVYVHYPEGMGRSRLTLPRSPGVVTARNLNTVTKLVEMCSR